MLDLQGLFPRCAREVRHKTIFGVRPTDGTILMHAWISWNIFKPVALDIPEASKGAGSTTEYGLETSSPVKTLRIQEGPDLGEISEACFELAPIDCACLDNMGS